MCELPRRCQDIYAYYTCAPCEPLNQHVAAHTLVKTDTVGQLPGLPIKLDQTLLERERRRPDIRAADRLQRRMVAF
jgi:hypothetical protein